MAIDTINPGFWLKIISLLLSLLVTILVIGMKAGAAFMKRIMAMVNALQVQVAGLFCKQSQCDGKYESKAGAEHEYHRLDHRIDALYDKLPLKAERRSDESQS